jgi:hypothetical protein
MNGIRYHGRTVSDDAGQELEYQQNHIDNSAKDGYLVYFFFPTHQLFSLKGVLFYNPKQKYKIFERMKKENDGARSASKKGTQGAVVQKPAMSAR